MNQDALLALVGRIYDAGGDPAYWPSVLAEIADAFGAGDASLSAGLGFSCAVAGGAAHRS